MRTTLTVVAILASLGCSERERRESTPPGGDRGGGEQARGGDRAPGREGEGEAMPVGPAAGEGDEAEGEREEEGGIGGDDTCGDDPLEPDDDALSATLMVARSERGLVLCPGNEDWFRLDIRDGDGARAGLFASGLRLELRDGADVLLAVAAGGQQAVAEVVDGDVVFARISGATEPTGYDLFFESIPAEPGAGEGGGGAEGEGEVEPGECRDDDLEPNADPAQARALGVGARAGLALCAGDQDWFTIQVGRQQRLTVTMTFRHVEGDLDMVLYGPAGPPNALSSSLGGLDVERVSWDAEQQTQVYLQVVGFAGAGNHLYELFVELGAPPPACEADEHEPNESRFAAARIREGELDDLAICDDDDEDWFSVDVDEADDLEVVVAFSTLDGNLDLDLHKPSGSRVDRSATARGEEVVTWRAERDGRHTFRVYPRSVRGRQGVPYEIEVSVVTADDRCGRDGGFEPNDSRNQAEDLDPGSYRNLMLCFEEEDWYAVELNVGDEFEIELEFDDDQGDIDIQLFQPGDFSPWLRSESHSDDESVDGVAEESGEHLLKVFGEEADYELTYRVGRCEPDRYEPNDDRNRARHLRAGRHDNLTHCGDNEDWYAVDVDEGDDLTARIVFRNSDGNLDLHLYEPGGGGAAEAESEGFGGTEEVTWRAERDGEHLLRVFPHSRNGANAEYDLTIEVLEAEDRCPPDRNERNDSRFAARDIREGTTRDLTVCGDEDWFEIDVDEGQELTFEVRYRSLSPNGRVDLELLDPGGRREDSDRGSGGRCDVTHVAERNGDHHIRIIPVPDDAEVEYDLTVRVD